MQRLKNNSLNEIYVDLAKKLLSRGRLVGDTLELTNQIFTLKNIHRCYIKNYGREISLKYILAENLWYAAGSNDMWFISKFANKWLSISDDYLTSNSAYGYIMRSKFNFDQIEKIIELLSKDRNSRRACIIINDANENVIETKDEQCTMFLQFLIRNHKLHLTVTMRSNDFIYGLPNDVVAFIGLQHYIASRLKISIGEYTHFATSLHLYKKDSLKLELISKGLYDNYPEFYIDFVRLYENAKTVYSRVDKDPQDIIEICKEEGILYEI